MPPVSKPIRILALCLGLVVCLTAIGIGGASVLLPVIAPGQRPAWMLFGFEAVVLVAGLLSVAFGKGRFGDGPGLALACTSGTIVVASAFGWLSVGKQLGGYSLTPVLALRVICGLALAGGAAFTVLSRNPKAWKLAGLGTALGLPCILAAGAIVHPASRHVVLGLFSGKGMLYTAAAVAGAVILGGLLCASVHLLIKAFEMGRVE